MFFLLHDDAGNQLPRRVDEIRLAVRIMRDQGLGDVVSIGPERS